MLKYFMDLIQMLVSYFFVDELLKEENTKFNKFAQYIERFYNWIRQVVKLTTG